MDPSTQVVEMQTNGNNGLVVIKIQFALRNSASNAVALPSLRQLGRNAGDISP